MKHEDYKEMVALEALDALAAPDDDGVGGEERRALDAHLAACADCCAELEALREAAVSLVYAAPTHAPSPELRARILSAVKSTPREEARRPTANPVNADPSPASGVSSFEEFEKRREARGAKVGRRLFVYGSLAASFVVAALLITLALAWQRNQQLQTELARLSETVGRTEGELARTRADRELLAAPESRIATLAGTKVAERASARLTFDAQTGRALLTAADLPPAPPGKAYQLWFIAEGKPPIPGSVFQPDARGHAELHETIPRAGRAAAIFAVTLEPASGVSAPTGEIYLKSSAS